MHGPGGYLERATLPGFTEIRTALTMTLLGLLGRAVRRPRLGLAMLGAAWRFRSRGWWRRPPFLPFPPREYLDWRLHTAYGETGREPTVGEVERYVRWANRMHGSRRTGAHRP
jgi:hypothetical protein